MSTVVAPPSGQMDVEGSQEVPQTDIDNGKQGGFESASAKIWRLYDSEADKHDTELAETWRGQTDGMLIFTGLFSAVVSAFIIETYKMLLPDNGGATVALLTQLVAQSQPNGGSSVTSTPTSTQAFKPSGAAIRINILMFISLFLSLTCALMSTLIQQWAREYLQYSQLSAPPQKRGRVRAHLFEGLTKFQMRRMVESIPVFLHVSVFLFFFAFSDFLRTVNDTVGIAARCCFIKLLSAYLILSVLPLVISSSPYQTALTTPMRPCVILLRFIFRLPMWAMKGTPRVSLSSVLASTFQHNRSRALLAATEWRAASLDYLALQWLLKNVDEDGMDKFVTGLPALIHSPFITDATATMGTLVADGMLERVGEHLTSSMSSRELSQAAGITRAFACLEALDAIFSVLDRWTDNPLYIRATGALVTSSDVFRTRQDSALALRAACIRAVTFRKLIDPLSAPAMLHLSHLPPHLLPLALRLQIWTCLNSRLWRSQSDLEETESRVMSNGYDARITVVQDGHLINFLVLIRDVLSYAELPTLDLTAVWETLETIVGAFNNAQVTASASARSRFEEVHTDIREYLYVSNKGGMRKGQHKVSSMSVSLGDIPRVGNLASNNPVLRVPNKFGATIQRSLPVHVAERYSQLLEFMDKVARGLRLMAVLSASQSRPVEQFSVTGELRLRHDQIFAKDPFGALDVLDSFLSALPAFISSIDLTDACDTIEKMIIMDDLFHSIIGHLDASVNSEVPEATRERMSMTSLQVLVQVFTLLEDSPTIRWYELEVDTILNSANDVSFSEVISGPSTIYSYCVVGIVSHVIMGQYRSRIVQDQPPTVQNLEEQLFILKNYDGLCLGDEQERERREARCEGDPDTNREASSPQYLKDFLTNGPLQNLSIMAFHMVPHLEDGDTIPEIAWTILDKLKNVPGLADADDTVALNYFGVVRNSAHMAVVGKEGSPSQEQLNLLGLLNTVAAELRLPELPMPDPVTPPQTPPGELIPPDRSGYAPIVSAERHLSEFEEEKE